MNKEKINDFVNVWAQAVGLTKKEDKKYVNLIKTDIAKRCAMYENDFPTISTKDDDCSAYIIKPVNNEYRLEDFLLNRLMLGIRDISFTNDLKDSNGEYIADRKSLEVDVNLIVSTARNKATRHEGLKEQSIKILKKTIEHELGHCLKTVFSNGFLAPLGSREQDDIYKNIIEGLSKVKNGKYANQIKTLQEFNLQEESEKEKTGVRNTDKSDYRYMWLDEMLNETEALELTNSNEIHEIWPLQDENKRDSSSGNYVNVYNYLSGYATITGYGPILKSILGKKETFKAEYMTSSAEVFENFNQEYVDIVGEVWGKEFQKFPATRIIVSEMDHLMHGNIFDEETMLKLDEFFAKCYEKKIEKTINNNLNQESGETILKEIEQFQRKLTTNNDPQKREQLAHNIVFNNIKTRINELSIQNNQQPEKGSNNKMKFVNGLIQAYNDTESEYQYKERDKKSVQDIERVQKIFETYDKSKILDKNLIYDLSGKWVHGDNGFKTQYSQKQVSAMVRLLKSAQILTESKKINPEGRNYLEELTNIPDINNILKQFKHDFKDEDSYMYKLREMAKSNRANGAVSSYPPTQAEIYALDKTIPANNKQNSNSKIQINNVKNSILQSKVTVSDIKDQTQVIGNTLKTKGQQIKKEEKNNGFER